MDINGHESFLGKHLAAADLKGRSVMVHMEDIKTEEVGQEKDIKAVLYFRGKEKGLVLNVTNKNAIIDMYGTETDNWIGKPITLFASQTTYAGKPVACLRVKLNSGAPVAAPAITQPQNPDAPDNVDPDDVPF